MLPSQRFSWFRRCLTIVAFALLTCLLCCLEDPKNAQTIEGYHCVRLSDSVPVDLCMLPTEGIFKLSSPVFVPIVSARDASASFILSCLDSIMISFRPTAHSGNRIRSFSVRKVCADTPRSSIDAALCIWFPAVVSVPLRVIFVISRYATSFIAALSTVFGRLRPSPSSTTLSPTSYASHTMDSVYPSAALVHDSLQAVLSAVDEMDGSILQRQLAPSDALQSAMYTVTENAQLLLNAENGAPRIREETLKALAPVLAWQRRALTSAVNGGLGDVDALAWMLYPLLSDRGSTGGATPIAGGGVATTGAASDDANAKQVDNTTAQGDVTVSALYDHFAAWAQSSNPDAAAAVPRNRCAASLILGISCTDSSNQGNSQSHVEDEYLRGVEAFARALAPLHVPVELTLFPSHWRALLAAVTEYACTQQTAQSNNASGKVRADSSCHLPLSWLRLLRSLDLLPIVGASAHGDTRATSELQQYTEYVHHTHALQRMRSISLPVVAVHPALPLSFASLVADMVRAAADGLDIGRVCSPTPLNAFGVYAHTLSRDQSQLQVRASTSGFLPTSHAWCALCRVPVGASSLCDVIPRLLLLFRDASGNPRNILSMGTLTLADMRSALRRALSPALYTDSPSSASPPSSALQPAYSIFPAEYRAFHHALDQAYAQPQRAHLLDVFATHVHPATSASTSATASTSSASSGLPPTAAVVPALRESLRYSAMGVSSPFTNTPFHRDTFTATMAAAVRPSAGDGRREVVSAWLRNEWWTPLSYRMGKAVALFIPVGATPGD